MEGHTLAFDMRLALYGREFDVKRSLPRWVFGYQENVASGNKKKEYIEKVKATCLQKGQQRNTVTCLSPSEEKKKSFLSMDSVVFITIF